ncbi:MAG: proline--tRNA ligase [Eubacterium sp.]|nr:proline--tRNA ligase [Eubacterium sp.]
MKIANMVGDRFKEKPTDCVIDSHALMMRGGYMKDIAKGIYSQYPPLKRICRKIENIIREEMDAIDGQEVLFPVVMSSGIWEESGRYESIGSEMLRFTDRNGAKMLLGMTHEEAAVHLVRDYANSYQNYPFMIYQIQTKFRDEARPRAGLIRVREFTMKDAYSFHTSQEDLERYYQVVYDSYNRIFARAGVPEVITVKSDSGMMGGSIAHEYMLLTPVGEDSLAICGNEDCDYRANMEAAESIIENRKNGPDAELTEVYTPNIQTIEEICDFLKTPLTQSCKAVIYQKNKDDEYVVVFIRGDLDVNETKLTNYLGEDVHPAEITESSGLHAGYTGPVGLNVAGKPTILYDKSLQGTNNLSCGANKDEYHYTGLCMERDIPDAEYLDLAKIIDGGICPKCGKPMIKISRGIEVGNIFQLGTKYTKSMNMTYLDADGQAQTPIMGCYGIGVGRLAASVCEAYHDEYGPIWPITIAPWQVHLCALRVDDEATRNYADKLYEDLQKAGIEVIYDDRKARPGVMFSDADLLGVPIRLVVSPRNMGENVVELSTRDKSVQEKVPVDEVLTRVQGLIRELTDAIQAHVK